MKATGLTRRAAVVALAMALLPAACGTDSDGGSDGAVTISFAWWGSEGRATLTKKAVELFEQRNPGITVRTTFSAYAAYWEKLATQTAGGNPPDVLTMDTRYLSEYGGRNVLLDLNTGPGTQVSLADINPELANTGRLGDRRYAVPWAQNATSLVYEPAAYQAVGADPSRPMTWEQFRAAAESNAEKLQRHWWIRKLHQFLCGEQRL